MTLQESMTKIREMKHLDKGWNGYDAEAPSEKARFTANDFLRFVDILPNRVAPSVIGGIGITFRGDNNHKMVYVEIMNDGNIYILYSKDKAAPLSRKINLKDYETIRKEIEEYLK